MRRSTPSPVPMAACASDLEAGHCRPRASRIPATRSVVGASATRAYEDRPQSFGPHLRGDDVSGAGEIAQIAAGDFIGEMSLVDSVPPSATVTAKVDSVALFLDKQVLLRKLAGDHAFASRFYRALAILLSDRLRATERRMVYGEQKHGLGDEAMRMKDELDPGVLDQVSIAGERFDRLLKLVEEVAMKGAKF
jgi:CRP/FNR family cyclic AMP-dependent transcriptional regulator